MDGDFVEGGKARVEAMKRDLDEKKKLEAEIQKRALKNRGEPMAH